METPDFSPVGKEVAVTRELALEYDAQRDLISTISEAANQIESSLFATPSRHAVRLGRIALKDEGGARDPQGQLNLRFSENSNGSNATIDIRTSSDAMRLRLSSDASMWESYVNRSDTPSRVLSNESVVALLDTLLYKEGAMDPLLDAVQYPAIEIPRLLTNQFAHTASPKEILTEYDAFSGRLSTIDTPIELVGITIPDYDISVFSRLCILKTNRHTQYFTSSQAPIAIGRRTILKKYSYEFRQNNNSRQIVDAVGKIDLTSADGYSKQELERYIDQSNDKISESEILEGAAAAVLEAHTFPQEKAA